MLLLLLYTSLLNGIFLLINGIYMLLFHLFVTIFYRNIVWIVKLKWNYWKWLTESLLKWFIREKYIPQQSFGYFKVLSLKLFQMINYSMDFIPFMWSAILTNYLLDLSKSIKFQQHCVVVFWREKKAKFDMR